jgi:hypothetical protein
VNDDVLLRDLQETTRALERATSMMIFLLIAGCACSVAMYEVGKHESREDRWTCSGLGEP